MAAQTLRNKFTCTCRGLPSSASNLTLFRSSAPNVSSCACLPGKGRCRASVICERVSKFSHSHAFCVDRAWLLAARPQTTRSWQDRRTKAPTTFVGAHPSLGSLRKRRFPGIWTSRAARDAGQSPPQPWNWYKHALTSRLTSRPLQRARVCLFGPLERRIIIAHGTGADEMIA